MNIWHDVDASRISKDEFVACIEISKGSKMKYELDKQSGRLLLDRVLYTSTHYPANYGFIPRTYAGDNDPLDVLVLCNEEIVPMCLVNCYPIGVIKMIDSNEVDEKIIAICKGDPSMNHYRDISELPQHLFSEISHFFTVYKQLEGKETYVTEILGREQAKEIIESCIDHYNRTFVHKLMDYS